jgi:hypothetical protein
MDICPRRAYVSSLFLDRCQPVHIGPGAAASPAATFWFMTVLRSQDTPGRRHHGAPAANIDRKDPEIHAARNTMGRSRQPAQEGVDGLGRLDADAAVDGLDAVGAGDDGAQLELGDLRQVIDHPGDPQQQVPQRGQVG